MKTESQKLQRQLELAMSIVREQATVSTYAKEILMEIEEVESNPNKKEPELSERSRFEKFSDELGKLSKKYGVAIKSVGGVTMGKIKTIEYSLDYTSGDIMPDIIEWAE